MKIKTLIVSLLGFATLALMGCLQSPLLNHADAAAPQPHPQVHEETPACPILFSHENLCASITWVKMPTDQEQGEFTLQFWGHAQTANPPTPIDPGYTVFVKLFMPSMGHGSSPVITTPAKDANGAELPGVYDVTNVFFIMPGAWEIRIQLKHNNHIIDHAEYQIQI